MNDTTESVPAPERARFQFSLGSLMIWIAIIALAANAVIMNQRLSGLNQEFASQLPLSPKEVARQFESKTTLGAVTTKVKDVRYSEKAEAYRVKFSWLDSTSGKTWHSGVRLEHDGFGVYFGQIRNGPFLQPLGRTSAFPVAITTPSSFDE